MTMRDVDQPHVIYTGALPPHLLHAEEPEAEDIAFEEVEARRPVLTIVVTAALALAVGVAIGIFAVPLLQTAPHRQAALPAAAPEAPAAVAPIAPAAPRVANPAPQVVRSPAAAVARPPRVLHAKAPAGAAPKATRSHRACASGLSPVEQAICSDARIAIADEEMQSAYQRALGSGAPTDALRAAQVDWLVVREQAARRSTTDLAHAYRTRIAELNAAGEEAPH